MTNVWKQDIFLQKNLWSVYKVSFVALRPSRTNRVISWSSFVILFIIFSFLSIDPPISYGPHDLLQFINTLASQSFAMAVGVLGFLIAGFAIFTSLTNIKVFVTLANTRYVNYPSINNLQYVLFNFLSVFFVYFALLSLSMALNILSSTSSPVIALIPKLVHNYRRSCIVTGSCIAIGLCQMTIIATLRLKSFIWNLYQSILVGIALSDEFAPNEHPK